MGYLVNLIGLFFIGASFTLFLKWGYVITNDIGERRLKTIIRIVKDFLYFSSWAGLAVFLLGYGIYLTFN